MATVEEKMMSEVDFGFFCCYAKITKVKAEELLKEGFVVLDSHEHRSFPRLHKISWENSIVKGDIASLDENNESYNLSQKFWILTSKTRDHLR